MTMWLLTSLTLGVFLCIVLSALVRRAMIDAAANFLDRRQSRAVAEYRRQFDSCEFRSVQLADIVPPEIIRVVDQVSASYKRELPRLWFLSRSEPGRAQPSAFTTFFFVGSAPIIVCPAAPHALTPYQRFVLYHELGHAAGFQTSHNLHLALAAIDLITLWAFFAVVGADHSWGAAALIAYTAARPIRWGRREADRKAETMADLWGYWGLEAAGAGPDVVGRVRRQHALFLVASKDAHAEERIAAVSEWQDRERANRAERFDRMRKNADERGEIPLIVEHDMSRSSVDALAGVNALQRSDGDNRASGCAWLILTSLLLPGAIGVALAPVHLGWAFILAGVAVTLFLRAVLAELYPHPPTPALH